MANISNQAFGDLKIKQINRRKSGEAFEVILKPADENMCSPLMSPRSKKEASIDEIESRLSAAELRRKAVQNAVVNQVKAEERKVLKVQQKKAEADESFSTSTEENLKNKMSLHEENYEAALQAKIEKIKALNLKPEELKEKIQREINESREALDKQLQEKLIKSEILRQKQLQSVREKLQEKENHAQVVRQRKQQNAPEE